MSDTVDYSSQYNSLVNEYNSLVRRQAQLEAEVRQAQYDADASADLISRLRAAVAPPLEDVNDQLGERSESAREVLMLLDELRDAYLNIKNVSVSTAMLTGCQERHFTYFGDFNDLRRISLGYVVGLDTNLWSTDAPRKKVEKVYLANTEYWLAYATMSVMLWASGEENAAGFAVSKAMQMNEQKAALFFLIVNLRFERIETAKKWFKIYFDMLVPHNIPKEIQYLLQAVLCGAFGRDREFEKECIQTIYRLFEESKAAAGFGQKMHREISAYFSLCVSVSGKDYLSLSRACTEYKDMMSLMSEAERNSRLKDYFSEIMSDTVTLEDSLYSRIEDVLYTLIESNDDKEKELLDEMEYHQIMVQSKGNKTVADGIYNSRKAKERLEADIAILLVRLALDYDNTANTAVKKFALNTVKGYCAEAAATLPNSYRGKEKQKYNIQIDDWQAQCGENDFETQSKSLMRHDKQIINAKIKQDKVCKGTKLAAVLCFIGMLAALGIFAYLYANSGFQIIPIVFAVVLLAVFVAMVCFCTSQKNKIKKANNYIIEKNQALLKSALADMAKWRADYRQEDKVNNGLVALFSQPITSGGENYGG